MTMILIAIGVALHIISTWLGYRVAALFEQPVPAWAKWANPVFLALYIAASLWSPYLLGGWLVLSGLGIAVQIGYLRLFKGLIR
jgi:hypothetical protein